VASLASANEKGEERKKKMKMKNIKKYCEVEFLVKEETRELSREKR
jgi:hypothetical protein